MSFLRKNNILVVRATSGPLSKEIIGERLILKQRLFLLRMHKDTPTKSHITKFFSINNDLDKIEVKIEDED